MRRLAAVCGMLLALSGVGTASRAYPPIEGRVRLAVASPTIPRTLYRADPDANGWTGYVIALQGNTSGRNYTLTLTDGLTGLEELDAYFYTDLDGTGSPCRVAATEEDGSETGVIDCPGGASARWAIVVLRSGADARFTFSY